MSDSGSRTDAVAATFDEVAPTYLEGPAQAWEPVAARLIEVVAPSPGASALDVCCGAGAAALPLAEAVGPAGSVLGVDLSEGMLALARRRAAELGYDHVEFRTADMAALDVDDGAYDVVVCSLGLFFAADMVAAARELWRVVRPGGRVAVSTWHEHGFEPGYSVMWDALRAVRPGLERRPPPYAAIGTPERLRDLLETAGMRSVEILFEDRRLGLADPEELWKRIMTGGFRAALSDFDEADRARVHAQVVERARAAKIDALDASALFGSARKPE